MKNLLSLVGRQEELFSDDLAQHDLELRELVSGAKFLVIGGAGTIGQAVVKEIFKRDPRLLHVVDISENNLVELVRDIRSSLGYINGDFQALPLDCSSAEFRSFVSSLGAAYDFILNLSALKHVRSEKDPFSLMRMIRVNVMNTQESIELAIYHGAKKYFCVSTDKAANPVNMMGASKRIMEHFLMSSSSKVPISTARFANVAFSDGSLLHGFAQRIAKRQPIAAPNDVRRYFVTPEESGQLCLMSCLLGNNRDIFFPKLSEELNMITFSEIAVNYLEQQGYKPLICETEEEARESMDFAVKDRMWPCYFFCSDTTGEKDFEEFYMPGEQLDLNRFRGIGVVQNNLNFDLEKLQRFNSTISAFLNNGKWTKSEIVTLFEYMLPEFMHQEKGKYLDSKM